jgi:hypothetical protein
LQGIFPRLWAGLSIREWWSSVAEGSSPDRKGLTSLALLTVWEIWKERLLLALVTLHKRWIDLHYCWFHFHHNRRNSSTPGSPAFHFYLNFKTWKNPFENGNRFLFLRIWKTTIAGAW